MRLSEIVLESWSDKFDKFERAVRSKNMSVADLEDTLLNNFGVYLQPEIDPTGEPYEVHSASISPTVITSQHTSNSELLGKNLMTLTFGPGVTPETPVNDVSSLFSVLRHELSHLQQFRSGAVERFPDYVDPSENEYNPQSALYRVQPQERAAQALDVAETLAILGSTPAEFEHASETVYRALFKGSGTVPLQKLSLLTRRAVIKLLKAKGMDELIGRLEQQGTSTLASFLDEVIGQMALLRMVASRSEVLPDDTKRKYRAQYYQFMKAIKNVYPKAKAYVKTHKEERDEMMRRTEKARIEIRTQMQVLQQLLGNLSAVR